MKAKWPPTLPCGLSTRVPRTGKVGASKSFHADPRYREKKTESLLEVGKFREPEEIHDFAVAASDCFLLNDGRMRRNLSTFLPDLKGHPAGYGPLLVGDTTELMAAFTCSHALWSPLLPPAGGKLKEEACK